MPTLIITKVWFTSPNTCLPVSQGISNKKKINESYTLTAESSFKYCHYKHTDPFLILVFSSVFPFMWLSI